MVTLDRNISKVLIKLLKNPEWVESVDIYYEKKRLEGLNEHGKWYSDVSEPRITIKMREYEGRTKEYNT